jgi:nucleoside 2-deoxyribosyltransferase
MGTDPNSCSICDWPPSDVHMRNSGVHDGLWTECPRCGKYTLLGNEAFAQSASWYPEIRKALSCAARQASEAEQPLVITGSNALELAQPHMNTRVVDNQERLLEVIAKRSRRAEGSAGFTPERDFTLIDCYTANEFNWYLNWLQQQKLLITPTAAGPGTIGVTLTMDGWKRVQPLPRLGGLPGRCFVAMWFSDQTRAAYEIGIEPAVTDAGFKPIRIDRKEHNNEIPDEIIAEIRNCEFMVADFTGQRAGVYYEAGFAMGLGRKVIWCCQRDEISKLHFDTNHRNHINWQTPEELRERLYNRIRATILEQG